MSLQHVTINLHPRINGYQVRFPNLDTPTNTPIAEKWKSNVSAAEVSQCSACSDMLKMRAKYNKILQI